MLRRLDIFATDEAGRPVSFPDLDPWSTFVICRDENAPAIGAMESRDAVDRWIDGCVFGDLRTLILGIDGFHQNPQRPRPVGGCNFLLSAGCFMALEYLAQVYGRGRDATSAARQYVADFLSRVDPRYLEVFEVLWSCFRNGIVHGSWPQAVCIRGDDSTRIAVGANPRIDGDHYLSTPFHKYSHVSGTSNYALYMLVFVKQGAKSPPPCGLWLAHNMCWTQRPPCRRLAAWLRWGDARSRRRS